MSVGRILVIEDDCSVRNLLAILLKGEGHQVVAVSDGNKGVAAYREDSFDLVLTDLFMPEKDGFEVITELTREFPEVKIVLMSGAGKHFSPSDFLPIALKLGAWQVLHKPFLLSDLEKVVDAAIGPATIPPVRGPDASSQTRDSY